MLVAGALGLLAPITALSVWQNDKESYRLRVTRPEKKIAARLDELRPKQCVDESLDTMFGDHYYPVHAKSIHLGGKECKYSDFVFPKKRSLGSGGYGTVRLALHRPTNQTFAVKSIIEMNPDWHKWIRAEECIQYGLAFPLIAKLYCTMIHDWYAWLVLELVEGDTLQRILQHNSMKVNPNHTMAQLVKVLEYLKLNNVVIGDLTGANVMLTEDGKVKLIDFGFARRNDPKQTQVPPTWEENRVLPDFASNPYSDWYALGMIMYEMMVALRPGIECPSESSESAEIVKDNPNMPPERRPERKYTDSWPNCAWIRPSKLKVESCSDILDATSCDLIGKFISYKDAASWERTWGIAPGSIELIKKHQWFDGYDWEALDAQTNEFMSLNAYNA